MPPKTTIKCIKFGEILIDENKKVVLICSQCFQDFVSLQEFLKHLPKLCLLSKKIFQAANSNLKLNCNTGKLLKKVNQKTRELLIYGVNNKPVESSISDIEAEILDPRWYNDAKEASPIRKSTPNKNIKTYNSLIEEVTPFVQFKENVRSLSTPIQSPTVKQNAVRPAHTKAVKINAPVTAIISKPKNQITIQLPKNPPTVQSKPACARNLAGDTAHSTVISALKRKLTASGTNSPPTTTNAQPVAKRARISTETAPVNQIKPSLVTQRKPALVNQQKPALVNQQKPALVNQQKPALVNQQKPALVNQQKPALANQQKPALVNQQKPAPVNQQKSAPKKANVPQTCLNSVAASTQIQTQTLKTRPQTVVNIPHPSVPPKPAINTSPAQKLPTNAKPQPIRQALPTVTTASVTTATPLPPPASVTSTNNKKTADILNKLQTLGLKVQRTNPAPISNEKDSVALEIIKKLQSKGMEIKRLPKIKPQTSVQTQSTRTAPQLITTTTTNVQYINQPKTITVASVPKNFQIRK